MSVGNERCVVVEVTTPERPAAESSGHSTADSAPVYRDLLPWADPYIARLLAKHRLQSALHDSLNFVAAEADRYFATGDRTAAFERAGTNRRIDHRYGTQVWRIDE